MNTKEKIQKVKDIAHSNGWSVNVEDKDKSNVLFEFQRNTEHGQDFSFYAEMSEEKLDTLIGNIRQYFKDFDPDYEASLWIGDDGHGKCGAPYHIKDIVSDMEDAEVRIFELLNALETEFS
ncbi:MAG: hypothetical protein Q4E63_05095 [Prevotellaceae bacterium]|nr:hypothetical protein [Prevotellaceae bacterium]